MKPRILAIDCSNHRRTSLGLVEGGEARGEINFNLGKKQSSMLPVMVEFLLGSFSLKVSDLDYLGVVTGPGSFTGLKVAAAFVQFLAWACGGKPIIPLSSLEGLAFSAGDRRKDFIVPVIWGGGGKVYSAIYSSKPKNLPRLLLRQKLFTPEQLIASMELLGVDQNNCSFLSDAPEKTSRLFGSVGLGPFQPAYSKGSCIARLAVLQVEKAVPSEQLKVNYLKDPDIG